MSTVTPWERMAATLFDREWRPLALLDQDLRVLKANAGFLALLAAGEFSDASRRAVRAQLKARKAGRLALTQANGASVAAEVEPLDAKSVLVTVVGVTPAAASAPITPAGGTLYEVELRHGQPTQVMKRLPGPITKPGAPCWAELGRSSACSPCPVSQLGATPHLTQLTTVMPGAGGGIRVISAELRSPTLASVSEWVLDPSAFEQLVDVRIAQVRERRGLTDQETRLFEAFVRGADIDEASVAMGITPRTVKYHQQNLLRKLGVDSRSALLAVLCDVSRDAQP